MLSRPISIAEAAAIRGVTKSAIVKAVATGRLAGVLINGRGMALSREQVSGEKFSLSQFTALCKRYISVPEACEIVRKTDAMVIRDLKKNRIDGFKLNGRAWAVDRKSAEAEYAEYLSSPKGVGQPRQLTGSRSPRNLRAKKVAPKKRVATIGTRKR